MEAVIDKDLTAAVLARAIGADALVIATDVENAVLDFGRPEARPVGRVPLAEMEGYAADGQFASGSMGPKVEAAMRFVRQGGGRSVITALHRIADALSGEVGTIIEATTAPAAETPGRATTDTATTDTATTDTATTDNGR